MTATTVLKLNIGAPTLQKTLLREETARLWNRLVKVHKYCRKRHWKWPNQGQLEKHFKGRFFLHSQTIQAIIGKFAANIDSTRTKRKEGDHQARYPWRDRKRFQVVVWKGQSIKREGNRIKLPNGKGRKPLFYRLPDRFPPGKIVQAELGFRALRLTLSRPTEPVESAGDDVVAADLGVIHLAAMTDGEDAQVIVGRGLRALVQYRNKQLATYTQLLSACKKGARRWKKLRISKARMLARNERQQHNLLHHAANQLIDYCVDRKTKKGSRRCNYRLIAAHQSSASPGLAKAGQLRLLRSIRFGVINEMVNQLAP